jgi:GNAT superfamily N-acetyltransferase
MNDAMPLPPPDLALLERWLRGWSLARGLSLPRHQHGGLVVEVGRPDQLRRHLFVDAGAALQQCAATIDAPRVFIKATVLPAQLRAALPARWQIDSERHLMGRVGPMACAPIPPGYTAVVAREHGASVVRLVDDAGQVAASGALVIDGATAVFDNIDTAAAHRRRGLGRALMGALDALARQAGVSERLLVATDAGRALYLQLGWQVLAPYATAVLKDAPFGRIAGASLLWRQH